MKKLILGFVLFVIAYALLIPLTIINIVFVLITKVRSYQYLKTLGGIFLDDATSMDKYGNRSLRTMLNILLKKRNGYKFGNKDETISSVLGKNEQAGTLRFMGKLLCFILNIFDRDHCEESIDNNN